MYDVLIIGGGVTGSAIARELSRYDLKTALFEKGEDVCSGTSKANSGIAHAGFDAVPGSWKAKMNIRGSQMMEELSRKLDFPYKRNGSLVLCFDEKDRPRLEKLLQQGKENGRCVNNQSSGDGNPHHAERELSEEQKRRQNAEKTQKKRNSCPARQIHQHGSHHAAGKQKQIERVRGEYFAVGAGGTDECDACKKLKGHCQNQRQIKESQNS